MSLPEAVIQIDGQAVVMPPVSSRVQESVETQKLLLPEKNKNNDRIISYLRGRGIHRDIIDYCIRTERLYESRYYHNAVFIGFDQHSIPQYAMLRGTTNMRYMGEANGSNKHFSFAIPAQQKCRKLHLFESAIDLLSYGTLVLFSGKDWRQENYLSLAGIYKPKARMEESTPPAALMQFLKDYPYIYDIALHLDNDIAGRTAAKTIQSILSSVCIVSDEPPEYGKDVNDYLKTVLKIRQQGER